VVGASGIHTQQNPRNGGKLHRGPKGFTSLNAQWYQAAGNLSEAGLIEKVTGVRSAVQEEMSHGTH
jgi:hypothetical protein